VARLERGGSTGPLYNEDYAQHLLSHLKEKTRALVATGAKAAESGANAKELTDFAAAAHRAHV
jgi:hypothetical protein